MSTEFRSTWDNRVKAIHQNVGREIYSNAIIKRMEVEPQTNACTFTRIATVSTRSENLCNDMDRGEYAVFTNSEGVDERSQVKTSDLASVTSLVLSGGAERIVILEDQFRQRIDGFIIETLDLIICHPCRIAVPSERGYLVMK